MGNPYVGQDFFGFFITLGKRCVAALLGEGHFLVSDELQLLTLIAIALSCTIVGAFLVQAGKTMVANALSHTILLGIVVAFLMQRCFSNSYDFSEGLTTAQLLVASFVSALLTTFFTEYLTKKMHIEEDASIGLIFTLFFASGVILLTLFARNAHLGTELVMGSVDSVNIEHLFSSCNILILNIAVFFLFYKELKISIFDASFATLQGLKPALFRYLLLFQTAIVAMSSFQVVGVVMVLAFFVAPSLIVRPFVKSMGKLICYGLGVAIVASMISVALSRHILSVHNLGLSTGGLVVLVLFIFFVLSRLSLFELKFTRARFLRK